MPKKYPSLDALPFRPDVSKDPDNGFNRVRQIAFCTQQLQSLRRGQPKAWAALGTKKFMPSSGLSEIKYMAKQFIRHASESSDHYATVDFITDGAYGILKGLRSNHAGQKSLRGHLQDWDKLSHEHMVPGEFIIQLFANDKSPFHRGPLRKPMEHFSYRALVTKRKLPDGISDSTSEVRALGGNLESDLPDPAKVYRLPGLKLTEVPLEFYGLMRYEDAGLHKRLIPVSGRAEDLLRRYQAYRVKLYCRRRAGRP